MTSTARRFATATAVAALTLPATTGVADAQTEDTGPYAVGSIPADVIGGLEPFVTSVMRPGMLSLGSFFGAVCSSATNPAACA